MITKATQKQIRALTHKHMTGVIEVSQSINQKIFIQSAGKIAVIENSRQVLLKHVNAAENKAIQAVARGERGTVKGESWLID